VSFRILKSGHQHQLIWTIEKLGMVLGPSLVVHIGCWVVRRIDQKMVFAGTASFHPNFVRLEEYMSLEVEQLWPHQ
jgi:hypothetical protein